MSQTSTQARPLAGRVLLGDRGARGVTVTDGLNVTRTGDDGSFEVPGFGPFVAMTRPTGYSADPWFLPYDSSSFEFRLESQNQPVPFEFVQITDVHLSLGDRAFGPGAGDAAYWFDEEGPHERIVTTPAVLRKLLGEIDRRHHDAAFIIATGDHTNTGADDEFRAYADCIANVPVSVHSIPGNHDHMSFAPAPSSHSGPVPVTPYDHHLGPRWYSFDYGGVHFAAIDWTTHHLGFDAEAQERWLQADLAALVPGTPVILLTHDQMLGDFYGRLPMVPVASFSGHWHTSRVVEAAGTVHYNTGSANFGGLDYSPAHYRVGTWDGKGLRVTTFARGAEKFAGATFRSGRISSDDPGYAWTAGLSGGVLRGAPIIHRDLAIATSANEDRPGGYVEAFEFSSGRRVWSVALGSAVKSSAVIADDAVVAAAVTGETVCIDSSDGSVRWRTEIDEPLRLWTYLRPATDGERIFVGDVARFVALDVSDGAVVWRRDDLGSRENITCHAHPILVGETLILSFAAQVPDIWALEASTGKTIWPQDVKPESIYRLDGQGIADNLPKTPVSGFCRDPGSTDFYVIRLGSRIDRMSADDARIVWSSPFSGWFNPAAPVVSGDGLLASAGTGSLWCLDRLDGSVRWKTVLTESAPIAVGPYRDDGGALLASACVIGEHILVPLGDGRIVTLSSSGKIRATVNVGVPITSSLVVSGDLCVFAPVDGVLRALPLELLIAD